MYHHSSSYSGQGSNGFVPSQPAASSYGDLLQAEPHYYYYSQQQQQQQPPPFRRVVSTGDLGTPVPAVAVRYNTEERRERIEKYKNKRNQRNFQKKITYACRKTLADSRPRVKGRFARNVDDAADQPEFIVAEVSSMTNETNGVVVHATDASSNSSMPGGGRQCKARWPWRKMSFTSPSPPSTSTSHLLHRITSDYDYVLLPMG